MQGLHQVDAGGTAFRTHRFGPDAALDFTDVGLAQQLDHFKQKMTDEVMAKNENLQKEVEAL